MRFNNNRNFEKFQENIKLKKTSIPIDDEDGINATPSMMIDTSQIASSKVRY
jgi:hypothetical protein